MMHLALVTLVIGFESVFGQDVTLAELGKYRGTRFTTRNGKVISAYLGIPYAKPPVGPLRFRSPQRLTDPIEGVFEADTDANVCPQINDDGEVIGDEDCLYLNVYTTVEWPEVKLYPAMVYFHGGAFVKGSASSIDAGPEYLMDRDIVLVTVNYRLGPLGFLSTGDKVSPGNYGLKDQTLALQWVRDNILFFKAYPDEVTIFGEGAGGASTSYHALYNASRDLFQYYISQSGSPISIWAFQMPSEAAEHARDLAKFVNCSTSDSQVLVDCLREVDTNSLVDSNDIFNDDIWQMRSWGPTIEIIDDGFITTYPIQQVTYGKRNTIPGIVGTVKDDGLYLTADLYGNSSFYDKVANDPDTYVKYFVDALFNENISETYYANIKELYFTGVGSDNKDDFNEALTRLVTDIAFRFPAHYQSSFMINDAEDNLYFYEFDYRGSFSKTSEIIGSDKNIGVTHSDDMRYIFPLKNSPDVQLSANDEQIIDIMLDLWTSFAETGTPTAQTLPESNVWKSYRKENGTGLKIGKKSDPTATQMYLAMDRPMQILTDLIYLRIFDSFATVLTSHET